MSSRSLAEILADRSNSFNAVRLLAAIAVVLSHSYLLLLAGDHSEPFDGAPYNLGQIAVNVFFFLSGLMLSRSYALQPDWRRFALARILRVFPALVICGFVVAWLLGPFATILPVENYFADPRTLLYPFLVPFLFDQASLPGVFQYGFNPGEVNAPLWTVKYELLAYLAFGIAASLGLTRSRWLVPALAAVLGVALSITYAAHTFETSPLGSLLRFGFCFWLGTLAFQYADRIRVPVSLAPFWFAIGLGLSGLLAGTILGPLVSILGFAALVLSLGDLRVPGLTAVTSRTDISFGIYLYAWPLQQTLLLWRVTHEAWGLFLVPLAGAVVLALLSWHLVEKPALSLKHRLPRRIRADGKLPLSMTQS